MAHIKVGNENSTQINLYYTDHGKGRPFVLIHGYPFSGMAWEKIENRLLEENCRVICYDRRGFGMSSRPSEGYDYDTFASDLNILLNELNLQDVTLVGHSMGSGEVTRYLSKFGSERIANAVFVSPIPPFLLQTGDNPDGLKQDIFEDLKSQVRKDRYAFITEFLKNFYNLGLIGKPVSDEKLRADFTLASISSPIGMLNCIDTWLTDFRHDLPKIKVPNLIIQGDSDKILPLEKTGQPMAAQINAKLHVIKDGSHGIPWTHADEIAKLIIEFSAETMKDFRKTEQIPQSIPPLH